MKPEIEKNENIIHDPEAAISDGNGSDHKKRAITDTITIDTATATAGSADPSDKSNNNVGKQRIDPSTDTIPLTHPPAKVEERQSSSRNVTSKPAPLKLIHRSLLKVPMQIRYIFYGILSSVLFMVMYRVALQQ